MLPRVLELIQRSLIAILSVVLALAVFFAFRGVIETAPSEAAGTLAGGTAAPPTTTDTSTTLPGGAGPEDTQPGSVTTTILAALVAPWGDGSCNEARPLAEDSTVLRIYYNCGTADAPSGSAFVYREVPATNRVLTNTFRQLVRGPQPSEQAKGFGSFFTGSAVEIESVSLREGRAIIDFTGLDNMTDVFATQTAVEFFIANLGANAFQFSSVQAVEYRLDGNCVTFWELMGASRCEVMSRNQWRDSVGADQ